MTDFGERGLPLRRAGRWLNATFNLFAIAYLAGLFVMVGPAQKGFGWPFARALVWVVGVPAFYFWGIHDERKAAQFGRNDPSQKLHGL